MALQAVLLDLDGTVWDSFPFYADVLAAATGGSPDHLLEKLRNGGNVIQLLAESRIATARFGRLCAAHADRLALFPGARAGIEGLVAQNVPVGAVTSLSPRVARPMLSATGLESLLSDAIYGARKPSPRPLLRALARLGCDASPTCLYAGDLPNDAEAARRAAIRFAWASYGYSAENPDPRAVVLRRLDDLLQL